MYNKGKMYVGGSENKTTLYINGSFTAADNSEINHPGKTILIGDFINNVTGSSTVFLDTEVGRSGYFEFKNTANAQFIRGNANKATNPIKFPNTVIINNSSPAKSVTLDPLMSANVKNVTFSSGRLILDSKTVTNQAEETKIAHLWLEDGASVIQNTSTKANIQVNLDLGVAGSNTGRLIGFTPPFETLYSDYFFYNFLSIPSETELFVGNSSEIWNTNPLRPLKGGTGYILGQELIPYSNSGYYTSHLHDDWNGASFDDVVKNKYQFVRNNIATSFGQFNSLTDRFTGESLINKDVEIPLVNGYNYLGNPFMVPLDLTDLLDNNRNNWNITSNDVEKNFWVLAKGSNGYSNDNGQTFNFTATYLLGQNIGGTNYEDHRGDNLIAPMQMFVIKNNGMEISNFKIPRSNRTHGSTTYLRSSFVEDPIDELLIETTDKQSGGFDRLCIVFRNNATLKATDEYDTEKMFNRSGGVNQIYTRSKEGKLLTTNVIDPQTKQMNMYFEPPLQIQEVELKAYRLASLQSIGQVILEDKKIGVKIDLTKNPSYTFQSYPADKFDRFILHFSTTPTSIDEITSSSNPIAYYLNGAIYIEGLQNVNLGKEVSLYNMQGQILHKEKIVEITPCKIYKLLNTGIYLVKIEGDSHAIKLLVK